MPCLVYANYHAAFLLYYFIISYYGVNEHTNFNYLWTYDLYSPVCNVFDGGKSITRANFFGPNPSNGPCNRFAPIKHITYGAV